MTDDLNDDIAARLNALFPGSQRRHGRYPPPVVIGDKAEIKQGKGRNPTTDDGPATIDHWLEHLRGERGLGIIPVSDGMTTWGMIDIDGKALPITMQLSDVVRAYAAIDHRLIVIATKSPRSAHVLLRTTEPVPVADMIATLERCAATSGIPHDGVYPRQDAETSNKPGNWITMPGFGGDALRQLAYTPDGRLQSLGATVDAMERAAVPPADLGAIGAAASAAANGDDDTCTDDDRASARALLTKFADELEATTSERNNALNSRAFQMGFWIELGAITQETVERELGEAARRMKDSGGNRLSEHEITDTMMRGLRDGRAKGRRPGGQRTLVLDPNNPLRAARHFLRECCTDDAGRQTMVRWREVFWLHDEGCHRNSGREYVQAQVWKWLGEQMEPAGGGKIGPYKPNKMRVANVIEALASLAIMDNHIEPPTWLVQNPNHPPATEILAVKNGLLHLPTGRLLPPSPQYFCLSATDIAYDPDAPPPDRWLTFLDQIFDGDDDGIATLQEWLGYVLSPDTSQQKILLMVGQPRSGKGTVARIATGLVGRDSCAAPTLASLGGRFGLEPLIGRPLGIIADARMGRTTDVVATGERLLAVSGEDSITVDRKGIAAWTGRLNTRFMLMTTQVPRFDDASKGLARRFVVLQLQQSFLGREDHGLTIRLLEELPGILNWALAGYRRLHERGHFLQPSSASETIADLVRMSSPITAFIEDRCEIGSGLEVHSDDIWEAWRDWCENNGCLDEIGTRQGFGGDLRGVSGVRRIEKERIAGDRRVRWYAYRGLGLRPATSEAGGGPWHKP